MRSSALVLVAALLVTRAASAQTESDALGALRDRFRVGMDDYKAGRYGEAILVWDEIYRELGPIKGYRLAFNLGRAYDQIQNEPRALEFYEAYLGEVARRRADGETMEPVVEKQEREAEERLAPPRAKQGRLRIADASAIARVDGAVPRAGGYVAYVAPGAHTVTFRPGTSDEARVDVTVDAGQIVDVAPPAIKPPAPIPPPPVALPPPPPPPPRVDVRTEHPYPLVVPIVGASVTAVSFLVPALLYVRANDKYDTVTANAGNTGARGDYESARNAAYGTWAIPAVLGAATIALGVYYFLGEKQIRRPVTMGARF